MSEEYCIECGHSYPTDKVLEIRVSNHGRMFWCLNCAKKQLRWTDYRLILKKHQNRLNLLGRILSYQDLEVKYARTLDELELCVKAQLGRDGLDLNELREICNDEVYG
jgi:hypothetical protein